MSAYDDGYNSGVLRRNSPEYDPRWDFAAAAKAGVFKEFKRGFEDGYNDKERKS